MPKRIYAVTEILRLRGEQAAEAPPGIVVAAPITGMEVHKLDGDFHSDADDTANLDATGAHHGLLKKLPEDATLFMDGEGNWSTPADDDSGQATDPHGASQHDDIVRSVFLPARGAGLDVATMVALGASPDLTDAVAYADAATQGAYWAFEVPADWASGQIALQPVWSPDSTDAAAHAVRWAITAKTVPTGSTVTDAGTMTAFTGASAARTVGVVVYDTLTSTTLTPAAAGDLFRFELQRIGADAADTYVGVVNLLGVIVTYTANQ